MAYSTERRRFSRFIIQLAVRYQTRTPESEEMYQGQGESRDLSLSGGFFYLDPPMALRPGQFLNLTIVAPMFFLESDAIPHLTATAEIVRLEPPGSSNPHYGVAVIFVDNLSFARA